MKFQTEKKKPTLCIYTDEEFVAEKLEWEVSSLRQELDGTRAALRLQASRCRHLVAAFSTQLQRQESAARRERELRDEQLSRLLRALLVLDAGLRREQRNIREQLHSKDAVIHAQQLEIAMLRGGDDVTLYVLPLAANGETTSSRTHESVNGGGIVYDSPSNSQLESSKSSASARFRKHSQKSIGQHNKLKSKASGGVEEQPVVHRVETRGLEQLQEMASDLKDQMVELSNEDNSYHHDADEELPNRNLYEDYQHNPVLECVNQILLSDLEESEKREVRADKECYLHAAAAGEPETRSVTSSRIKIDRHVDKEESKLKTNDTRKWPNNKDKTPSPPAKEHLEEKACLMMSSQRLTLVRNVDFEEVDVTKEDESVNKNDVSQKRGAPPALPPKPSQLQLGSRVKKPSLIPQHPQKLPNPYQEKSDKPHQRKILSNGSLKYPLNHDHSLQENRHNNHNTNCTGKTTFEEKIEDLNITILHHNTPRGMAVMNGIAGKDHGRSHCEEKLSGKIRVGSSVSSLITGASGDSIVNELAQGNAPKVSNIVRRFEDLGTCIEEDEEAEGNETLRENFEEFKLEDVDMDVVEKQGRPDGDGAETKVNGGTYEHFLESTGLSQKSIMTPSRMLSNHRSVLKPKDIKHRSRLLKAAAITNHGGSIVKYWTEPFL